MAAWLVAGAGMIVVVVTVVVVVVVARLLSIYDLAP